MAAAQRLKINWNISAKSWLSQLPPATTAHFLTAEDEKEQELEQEGGTIRYR